MNLLIFSAKLWDLATQLGIELQALRTRECFVMIPTTGTWSLVPLFLNSHSGSRSSNFGKIMSSDVQYVASCRFLSLLARSTPLTWISQQEQRKASEETAGIKEHVAGLYQEMRIFTNRC